MGTRGEKPENTLVCTERPFAAGEFVFFHFCSTFSQAAYCLVSATLNNNNQHKKKKKIHKKKERKKGKKKKKEKRKEKKEKEKKKLLSTSRLHVHLP